MTNHKDFFHFYYAFQVLKKCNERFWLKTLSFFWLWKIICDRTLILFYQDRYYLFFTSSIRHILSSENSNSTILFCIFIRFSQHFSGLVIWSVWTLARSQARSSLSPSEDEAGPCPRVSVSRCYQIRNATHSSSSLLRPPLSSPRTLLCTVLYCTV